MNWYLFALISISSISVANLLQKVLMRDDDSDPYLYSIVFQFALAIITGIFAAFVGFKFPPINQYPLNFLLSACLYSLGTLLGFKALKLITASENILMAPFGALATIISAVIFLHEGFGIYRIFGSILIFIPIFLLNWEKGKIKINKGLIYAIGTNILYGLAVTNDAFILKHYDAISYTPIMSFLPGLILLLANPKIISKAKQFVNPIKIRNMFLFCFFYGIQAVTYYLALQHGADASQLSTIFKVDIITTIILATIFLKEREHLTLKFIGAILATAGILLLK